MPFLQDLRQRYPGLLALVLLLCSVPLQHLAKEESDVASRSEGAPPPRMARLKRYLASWYEWYGDLEEWLDEVLPPASEHDLLADYDDQDDDGYGGGGPVQFQLDLGDGLTVTNLTEDWFASSRRPRRVRPKTVLFSVGEVVFQNFMSMHCAIIGWDKVLKAPDVWIQMTYGDDAYDYEEEPHYTLLCDMREAESPAEEFQYAPQREMEDPQEVEDAGVNTKKILSTYLDTFFEGFDDRSGRYVPRPWLRRIYPRD